jgi:hypothetical protein
MNPIWRRYRYRTHADALVSRQRFLAAAGAGCGEKRPKTPGTSNGQSAA